MTAEFARGIEKRPQWTTPGIKAHLKRFNLERLRSLDKDEVKKSKNLLKKVLAENAGNFNALKANAKSKSFSRQELAAALSDLGYKGVTEDQVDVMMYYINPYHQGKVSKANIDRAVGRLEHLGDGVTADLRDGVSVASSQLGSMPSMFESSHSGSIDTIKRRLNEIKSSNGTVLEKDFRLVIAEELPHLQTDTIDQIVSESMKKPNRPHKIFDEVIPGIVMKSVAWHHSQASGSLKSRLTTPSANSYGRLKAPPPLQESSFGNHDSEVQFRGSAPGPAERSKILHKLISVDRKHPEEVHQLMPSRTTTETDLKQLLGRLAFMVHSREKSAVDRFRVIDDQNKG